MANEGLLYRLSKWRTFVLRAAALTSLPLVLCGSSSWDLPPPGRLLCQTLGALLVTVGVFGRLWCTLYIGGRKGKELVTDGPYACCRHPLYFFSLLLGVGVTLGFRNGILLFLLLTVFLGFHAVAIASEERSLAARFGAAYETYRRSVPLLFPVFRRRSGGGSVSFSCRQLARAMAEVTLFLLALSLAEVIERLKSLGGLPKLSGF